MPAVIGVMYAEKGRIGVLPYAPLSPQLPPGAVDARCTHATPPLGDVTYAQSSSSSWTVSPAIGSCAPFSGTMFVTSACAGVARPSTNANMSSATQTARRAVRSLLVPPGTPTNPAGG